MVEKSSFKIFLTSGITLTINDGDKIDLQRDDLENNFEGLIDWIEYCINHKVCIDFKVDLTHIYKNEKDKEKTQKIKHHYKIPYDKISWYMIEEV